MRSVDEPFGVRTFHHDGSVLVALCGELDIATAPQVEVAVAQVLGTDLRDLTVDMSDLSFLDVCGQRALLGAAAAVKDAGARFQLRGVNEPIRRSIRLVGFRDLERACDLAPD